MQLQLHFWHIIVFVTILYILILFYRYHLETKSKLEKQIKKQDQNIVEHEMITVDLDPEEIGSLIEIHTRINTVYSCMGMAGSWDEREHWRAQYQAFNLLFNQELERLARLYIDEFNSVENPFNIQINMISGKLFFCLGEKPISFR